MKEQGEEKGEKSEEEQEQEEKEEEQEEGSGVMRGEGFFHILFSSLEGEEENEKFWPG